MRYQIHRGGQARTVKGAEARRKIRRELHGLALAVQGDATVQEIAACAPATTVNVVAWWTDLRRSQVPVYGALLRFIDLSVRKGTPKETLLVIPQWIESYITEQYDPTNTGELKLVA